MFLTFTVVGRHAIQLFNATLKKARVVGIMD